MKIKLYRVSLFVFLSITLLLVSINAYSESSMTFRIYGLKPGPIVTNIQKRLMIEFANLETKDDASVKQFYETSQPQVQKAIEPYGYFYATVTPKGLMHTKKGWLASYAVSLGQPLLITELYFFVKGEGASNPEIIKTRDAITLHVGNIFSVPDYNKARNDLLFTAQQQGYLGSKMSTDKIKIDLFRHTCSIDIIMDTGQRYYFGSTLFSTNPLNPSFLARYLNYKPGDPFSASKLTHLQNNLGTAGYFKSVIVTPKINEEDRKHVPVNVALVPYKQKVYQFGLGYGTLTGVRATLGINWRWVNQWGHKFNTSVTWSKVTKNIAGQYLIPARDPVHNQYAISGTYYTYRPRHGRSTVGKGGVGYITNYGRWQRAINLAYQVERYKVWPDPNFHTGRVLLPSLTYSWVSTTNPLDVTDGARANFLVQGSSKGLVSSVSFIQAQAQAKLLKTIWKDNRFIFKANYGYSIINNPDRLPLSLRFYAGGPGGPTGVRGYAINGIGPGRYLVVGSAEYQRRVYGHWYAATFYDTGNAFDTFSKLGSTMARSAGLGAVWQSPIGDVSLYVAKALSTRGQPYRIQFSLGPVI